MACGGARRRSSNCGLTCRPQQRRPVMIRVCAALAVMAAWTAAAGMAAAQEGSLDRAEFDLAAGRPLFQNTPLVNGVLAVPETAEPAAAEPQPRTRRPIRVVLPSPYGR